MQSVVKSLWPRRVGSLPWKIARVTIPCMPTPNIWRTNYKITKTLIMDEQNVNGYSDWSTDKLIKRVTSLEQQLRELTEKYKFSCSRYSHS